MIVSLHIPKCAGTSFRNVLEEAYGSSLWLNYGNDFSVDSVPPFTNCIHGHILGNAYADVFPGHQLITMVRSPVERVVSNYYHFIHYPDFRNPACIQLHEHRLSLREFAAIESMRNEVTRYVASRDPEDFDFVGITERFEASVLLFRKLFRIHKILPFSRDNVNPERLTPSYPISPPDEQYLLDLNAADLAWYIRACEVFTQKFKGEFGFGVLSDAPARTNCLSCEERDQIAVA